MDSQHEPPRTEGGVSGALDECRNRLGVAASDVWAARVDSLASAAMSSQTHELGVLPTLAASPWQMSYGERAALEGIVSQLRPALALEIGTAEGGSLRRIAAHSEEVHSFDLVSPSAELANVENATFHTGDSHELLPQVLSEFSTAGRSIDFVLVDGDHTAEGVRRDLENVLSSPALKRTMVLLHDTMNPDVRKGIEGVDLHSYEKIALVDLDFVPGYLARREPYRLQLWGGLGLVVVDAEHTFNRGGAIRDDRFHELFAMVRPTVEVMAELEAQGLPLDGMDGHALEARLHSEIAACRTDLARRERLIQAMEASLSWCITSPLRGLKRYAMRGRAQ
jgi:predicted O-methyltransferase YrrM